MKPTTLKDIATELNISIATVSKSLKSYSDVSRSTRAAVVKMVKKMNYNPNVAAVNLRTQQSKTIGVIIPTVAHQFFSEVLSGIIEEAEKNGYLVITLQSNEQVDSEKRQILLLQHKRVDGILISLSNETYKFKHIEEVIQNNIPVVLFDKISKIVNCSKVTINDCQAAYDAVTYLIKKGYKKIAHFRGSLKPQNSIDRFVGYKKALVDNGISFDPLLVYLCDNNDDFNDGFQNARKLLDEQPDVDAIFAITDSVAVGIYNCFHEVGIKVPEDIAIFGFSNWFMSSVLTPSLSTIQQPGFEMGRKSCEILLEEIKNLKNDISYNFQQVVLPTSLVIRNST
ncbi:LacI family DNA-binding transcriptional regulator [Lutibacter sp.]|uniref:LacI family DNA-binding transcriptional regulator n=1 Tax=Lutibacter sp. TaxID=1925666 RepID=UPI00273562DB|nr:LacI family DNA-binding transcriptional regulator [Lutibacter sp.]MDP3314043.1 LacI family DNA-binding transcriptional regulator [Lutibacter sp.]